MDPRKVEIDHEFFPVLRVYKDGSVERLLGTDRIPASIDAHTSVSSKDVTINKETGLSARLYIPKINLHIDKKLPLLIYFHGGSFLIESAFSPLYHNYLNSLVEEANVIVVSVEYRLAPEHPLPIAYEDSWEAVQWVAQCGENWLRACADFNKVFLAGDSAGANIVHNMAMRVSEIGLANSVKFHGIVLVQPYFWGKESIGSEESVLAKKEFFDKLWIYACPSTTGHDDPLINPVASGAPSLCNMGCKEVLVFVAEKDVLRDRGWLYYEELKNSGWGGEVRIIETEGEDHVFHLFNPTCDNATALMKNLASFINQDKSVPM